MDYIYFYTAKLTRDNSTLSTACGSFPDITKANKVYVKIDLI
jgi:hypothetical protein